MTSPAPYEGRSRLEWDEVKPAAVQTGDVASHIGRELDPRVVTRVDHAMRQVWLDILNEEAGPFPLLNYTYSRGRVAP